MPKSSNPWQVVSIHPLTGVLDTRSRPSDIPAGGFRWKQNFAVTPDAKLCRRSGFDRAFGDKSPYTNYDFHRQGGIREPITFLHESTFSDGIRRLYIGTQSRLQLLNEATGEYIPLLGSMGTSGTRWKAAELQDYILFTNNYDPVYWYSPGTGGGPVTGPAELPSLIAAHVTRCAVIIEWNGFMFAMNMTINGDEQKSRVWWSDINNADGFALGVAGSLAGFQDLDYGDEILAAAPLLNALYIFTRQSIWKAAISATVTDPPTVLDFTKVYTEPRNQTGCIAFPNTLVSTGQDLFFMGRDGIYRYNPYLQAPERDDWLHRADGLIYRKLDSQLDPGFCLSPVAEYRPGDRELWISWPSIGQGGVNNWTLVSQVEQKTSDVADHGFTAFCNYRRTPVSDEECNEAQDFLAASGTDWCIKSVGGVFYRELAVLDASGDATVDLPEAVTYLIEGYYSILRGMIPLGLTDRDKVIRSLLIDHDTSEQDAPCAIRLRIGNSFSMVDPNDTDDICVAIWRQLPDKLLQCPDSMKISQMLAKGLRPAVGTEWKVYFTGRFLFYEITIANQDGTAAVGGDTCFQRIDFDAMAMPKA